MDPFCAKGRESLWILEDVAVLLLPRIQNPCWILEECMAEPAGGDGEPALAAPQQQHWASRGESNGVTPE